LPENLVIDLTGGPDNLDPALARSVRDWSIIHSIYDSIIHLGNDGVMTPLAAETFAQIDDVTWEVALREGLTFHDGTPVLADAITRGIQHVQGSEGPAAQSFGAIERVEEVDDLAVRLVTGSPAPWLPSQLAVWLVLFPEAATGDAFETAPVGSGPYRFVSREAGNQIVLERNPDYFAESPKGQALAEQVTYRFVPEVATRIADLSTGATNLVTNISPDDAASVTDAGAEVVEAPVLGTSFLRIVNDVAPFNDPNVRRALNLAVDVESIASALVSGEVRRLASLYPDDRAIGFDPDLPPFEFDPDQARALLADAGYEDGFETRLQFTGGARPEVMEAIAANLADVGVSVTVESTELATFNGTWQDPDSAPLRFVEWRPVYDPHTVLSLMFASTGPLSRYADDESDRLIAGAAAEPDPEARARLYRELGAHFQEAPPAIFLWNLTALYGVKDFGTGWQPRGDEYVIPTSVEDVP